VVAGQTADPQAATQGTRLSSTSHTPWMIWKHRNDCIFQGS
jgi:hypothetical protein